MKYFRSPLFLLIILSLALWAFAPGLWDLWGPDECRYVQISKELLQHRNPFHLTVNGEFYEDKPPLPFILMAIPLAITGGEVNALLCRYPSIIMGILILIFTFIMGRRMFSERAGLIAALCLMTAPLFWQEVPSARLDIQLTFWVTLSLWIFTLKPQIKLGGIVLFWLAAAGGVLTKGPVALVFIISFLWGVRLRSKDERPFQKVHFIWGMIAVAVILFGWMWAESRGASMDAVRNQAQTQIIQRIFSPKLHKKPFWYYTGNIPVNFAPWIIAILGATYFLIKNSAFRSEHLKKLYPLIMWFCIPFIFFSVLGGKREQYLLPVYPAMALFAGWYISEVIWEKKNSIAFLRGDIWGNIFKKVFIAVYLATLITLWIVFPMLNERKSSRPLCLHLSDLISSADSQVGIFKNETKQVYQVYGNYRLTEIKDIPSANDKSIPPIILGNANDWTVNKDNWRSLGYEVDSQFKLSGRVFVIWIKRER